MKRKSIVSVIFTAALALASTSACSDNNDDELYLTEQTSTEAATTETTTAAETETETTTDDLRTYNELTSTYSGTYVATQGLTGLDFSVFGSDEEGVIQALFSFHEDPANPGVPTGSYLMEGTVDEEKTTDDIVAVDFKGSKWEKKPDSYHIIEFKGIFDLKNGTLESDDYQMKLKKSAGAELTYLIKNYEGTYTPDTGENKISFTVEDIGYHGDIQAVFEYEPEKDKICSFISEGQVTNIDPDGKVTATFTGSEWIIEPEDKKFIDFEGVFNEYGLHFSENGGHNIELDAKR